MPNQTPDYAPHKEAVSQFDVSSNSIVTLNQLLSNAQTSIVSAGSVDLFEFAVSVPDPWIAVSSFSNGWVNYAGGLPNASYMKHPNGVVQLKGVIKNGTIGLAAFVLPASMRPDSARSFGQNFNGALGLLNIDAAGNVVPFVGSNVYSYINCSFLASDSRPIRLSCWPKFLKISKAKNPSGVVIVDHWPQQNKRTPQVALGAAPLHVQWKFVKKADGNYVQINNITGLPYSTRTKIRLMIIGD